MSKFDVISIEGSNTITVTPRWKWGSILGNIVRIEGFNPSPETELHFIEMLDNLLLTDEAAELVPKLRNIELRNPTYVDKENLILHCSVFLNSVNIANYLSLLEKQK